MSDCGSQIGMHQIGMHTQPDGRVTQIGLEIGTQGARDSRVSLGGVPGQARPSLRDVSRAIRLTNRQTARLSPELADRAGRRNTRGTVRSPDAEQPIAKRGTIWMPPDTSTHDMRKVQGAAAVPDLREAAIAAREDAVVKREAAVAGREARLTAQELALKAREAAIEKAESDARGAGEPANMVIPLSSSGTSGRGSGLS